MSRRVSSRFSPRSLEPAQLERTSVGNEALFARLEGAITAAVATGQARYDLVLGPRGAGKSHLIGVLQARLSASERLEGRALVIAPPEELHPTSLVQLLALLLREFPDDPELGPPSESLRSLQRQRDGNQEQRAISLIRARLDGRALVLLLENLDELFGAIGREGQQRLRNVLQTEGKWSILATSRSLVPAFTKHEAPFHGTFNLHRLSPFEPEQCRDMLERLAEARGHIQLARALASERGLQRVRGIHHLLGGNPRAMAFIARHLDEHSLDHFEDALTDLADDLKPYFQEQMTRLSPAQRGLMEILAESWHPLTVTQLAERSFTKQASTSGTLRHLKRDGLVKARELGRERYYELGDPLHRLARANERPREAIRAFALVLRWWYANDSAIDFNIRSRYLLPKQKLETFAAAELEDTLVATPHELETLLPLLGAHDLDGLRERLELQPSPAKRAALVLELELRGQFDAADATYDAELGARWRSLQTMVLTFAGCTEHPSIDAVYLTQLRFEWQLAEIIRLVQLAEHPSSTAETRGALLSAFDTFDTRGVRRLSSVVAHSGVIGAWANRHDFDAIGQLLVRLRPPTSTPSLEFGLVATLMSAWHRRALAPLLFAPGSLEGLRAALPQHIYELLRLAALGCTVDGSLDSNDAANARLTELFGQPEPEPSTWALPSLEPDPTWLPLVGNVCLSLLLIPGACENTALIEALESSGFLAAMCPHILIAAYTWLASRRPLAPLRAAAPGLRRLLGVWPLAAEVLEANSPREAVARLASPERELIRELLTIHGDDLGKRELMLEDPD